MKGGEGGAIEKAKGKGENETAAGAAFLRTSNYDNCIVPLCYSASYFSGTFFPFVAARVLMTKSGGEDSRKTYVSAKRTGLGLGPFLMESLMGAEVMTERRKK